MTRLPVFIALTVGLLFVSTFGQAQPSASSSWELSFHTVRYATNATLDLNGDRYKRYEYNPMAECTLGYQSRAWRYFARVGYQTFNSERSGHFSTQRAAHQQWEAAAGINRVLFTPRSFRLLIGVSAFYQREQIDGFDFTDAGKYLIDHQRNRIGAALDLEARLYLNRQIFLSVRTEYRRGHAWTQNNYLEDHEWNQGYAAWRPLAGIGLGTIW